MTRRIATRATAACLAAAWAGQALAQAPPAGAVNLRTPLTIPGGTAPRTLLSKLGETLSVHDFGGRCDGTTDDSLAVLAAAASGRLVNVPSGSVCLANGVAALPPNLVGGGLVVLSSGAAAATPSVVSAYANAQAALSLAAGSTVRLTAVGGTFTVPPATTWLAMVQRQPVAAETLVLPATPADGQRLRISTVAQVTALSLSPAVAGWANGSMVPANTGFEIDWDAASSSWLRVQ